MSQSQIHAAPAPGAGWIGRGADGMLPEHPPLRVTLSAGLTDHIAGDVVDALDRADRALYEAKAEVHNRIVAVSGVDAKVGP
jgi:GGDEF domain-containing protein